MKRNLWLGTVAAVALIGAGLAPAHAADGPEIDPISVIADAAPEVLDGVAALAVDGSKGIEATLGHVSVEVPADPVDGITLAAGDAAAVVGIGLPNADQASAAVAEGRGIVSYDNGDGSTTVPVVKDDGSVQINTIIADATAPIRYEYPLDVPDDATVEEIGPEMFAVLTAEGEPLTVVLPPWAKDAQGVDVPTHYEIESGALVQYVDHDQPGVAYPVVADPKFAWYGALPSIKTTRSETALLRGISLGAQGVVTTCTSLGAKVGLVIGALCGVNSLSIAYNANWIYNAGKCSQLLIGPGVIGSVAYKDSYCR